MVAAMTPKSGNTTGNFLARCYSSHGSRKGETTNVVVPGRWARFAIACSTGRSWRRWSARRARGPLLGSHLRAGGRRDLRVQTHVAHRRSSDTRGCSRLAFACFAISCISGRSSAASATKSQVLPGGLPIIRAVVRCAISLLARRCARSNVSDFAGRTRSQSPGAQKCAATTSVLRRGRAVLKHCYSPNLQ
jgi:hypothetical protein